MADRYEDFDRNRDRDRNREGGQRYDEYRRESRGEGYGQGGRDWDQYDRNREYGRDRESWRGENYGSEGRYGSRYGAETSEYGQGGREDWRSRDRGSQAGQNLGGGMGSYSGQDWRTQRYGSYGGGMSEGWDRNRESREREEGRGLWGGETRGAEHQGGQGWDRNRSFGEGYQGGTYGQNYGQGYGQTYGQGFGQSYGQGFGGQSFGGQGTGSYGNQATGGGRYVGRGPKGYQRSDERIREDVCERLTQHPEIDASEIDIQVSNGEVTLAGAVEDRHQKRLAEDITENVSGIREVNNQLRVSKGLGQRIGEALGFSGRDNEENRTAETGVTGRQPETTGSRR